jgi:hypothetical protein
MRELFSDRLWRKSREGKPVVYQYEELPEQFRVKVRFIMQDAFGAESWSYWAGIRETLMREKGIRWLGEAAYPEKACIDFLFSEETHYLLLLDMIEIGFYLIDSEFHRENAEYNLNNGNISVSPDDAIARLNEAFLRHGLGYQFVGGQLIRIDSLMTHSELVEPAISLLHDEGFEGPLREFMEAHQHYRHGQTADAIVDANNAFESTIKAICEKRGKVLAGGEKPEVLIKNVLGLIIPKYLENSLTGLRSAMQALPSLRSNTPGAGHGAGPKAKTVLDYTAAYAIHLSAANIVYLIEAYRELEKRAPTLAAR